GSSRNEGRVLSGGSTQHLSCSHLPNVYHDFPPLQERIHSGHRSCLHLTDCPGPATSSQATAVDQAADNTVHRRTQPPTVARTTVIALPLFGLRECHSSPEPG